MKNIMFHVMIAVLTVFTFQACHSSDGENKPPDQGIAAPQVINGGSEIRFAQQSPQLLQISTDTVRERTIQIDFSAPTHLAVSVAASEFGDNNVYLFENQDLTQLYSDFLKSISAVNRTSKNLERFRDLLTHKAVAEKEVIDAQAEYAQSQAELAEKESRLRAAGIDPRDLEITSAGTVLAIADIPEGQVGNIKLNTRTEVQCSAYTGETFIGEIAAIGDVIDPNTRTVKVRIMLANPHNKLRAGMFGTARFIGSRQKTLAIPRSAVMNLQGKTYVFLQNSEDGFQRKEIQLGSETTDLYVVKKGLQANDIIVVGGVILLKQLSFGY